MKQYISSIAIERIEQEMKSQSGILNLSDCGLTSIPDQVFELEWLTELIITNDLESNTQKNTKLTSEPNVLVSIPKDIARLKDLKKLRIGAAGTSPWAITDISPLSALKSLEELNLSGNRIIDIDPLIELNQLTVLDLSQNEIEYIPPFNSPLKTLDLSNNHLIDTYFLGDDNSSYFLKLEWLSLQSNQIKGQVVLDWQEQLNTLNLSNNHISEIYASSPKPNLKFLYFNVNEISSLEVCQQFPNLEELSAGVNQIIDISPIRDLIKIQSLVLDNNPISDLSALERLTALQELFISGTNIYDLSQLKNLSYLKELHCNFTPVNDISPLTNLSNLRELSAENCTINLIQPLTELPRLEKVKLDNNPIEDAPPEVWQTNDINQIRAFFESIARDTKRLIEQDEELEQIKLKRDKLQEQSEALKQEVKQSKEEIIEDLAEQEEFPSTPEANIAETVSNVEEISEKEAEHEKIQEELAEAEAALQEKLASKKRVEAQSLNDVKIIFVGNSGVGKTQLSKMLESGKLDTTRESTHGIRLNRWLPQGKVSPAFQILKDKAAVNIWDFGGQEYYHGTFRLFLSNYAVYVLLWDGKTNYNDSQSIEVSDGKEEMIQHYHFSYWLDNIRHYAPTSKVILVQNKIDAYPKEAVDTTSLNDYEIFADHYISLHQAAKSQNAADKWRFDLFCQDLAEAILNIPEEQAHWQKSIAWLDIRDAVVSAAKTKKKDPKNPFSAYLKPGKRIPITDFEKACLAIESELSENELKAIPRWLHNSGTIIYFHENQRLKQEVFLSPTWVTRGIYATLSTTVRENKGAFQLDMMTKNRSISNKMIIELMREMEIIFEQEEEKDGKILTQYVAPQYLPETHPVEDLYAIAAQGLQHDAFYVSLPLYFFRKVLQRMIFFYGMSPDVEARYYWKKGILFKKRGTRVMFKGISDHKNSQEGVFLIGAEPKGDYHAIQKEVFHIILEILEEKDLSDLVVKNTHTSKDNKTAITDIFHRPNDWTVAYTTAPTPRWLHHLKVSQDAKNFVSYLDLCNANREGQVFIHSMQNQRLKIHDFSLLLDHEVRRPLKIFFSYSHKDTELMNRLNIHLAPLKRDRDDIEVWTDRAIQPGEEWDTAIKDNLTKADVVLFLVSADFIASSYIWEKEIPAALQEIETIQASRQTTKKKVIPIYLRPFDYSSTFLANLELIPKNKEGYLQAISQWPNMDEAFTEVAQKIKGIIEEMSIT
jgi:Leucine-rich repeat (LRR) protein/GTPase SAR1 family protein